MAEIYLLVDAEYNFFDKLKEVKGYYNIALEDNYADLIYVDDLNDINEELISFIREDSEQRGRELLFKRHRADSIFDAATIFSSNLNKPYVVEIQFIGDLYVRKFITSNLRTNMILVDNDCCQFKDSEKEVMLTAKQFGQMIEKYPDWEYIVGDRYPGRVD